MDLAVSKKIPGMVETIEQKLLFETARDLMLQPDEAVVEFGTFFGRSTWCLAEGLAANPRRRPGHRLHAYDGFRCPPQGRFADYVRRFAEQGGVGDRLQLRDGMLDFRAVFDHYLAGHLDSGLLRASQGMLAELVPLQADIALMHVDCPKSYADFKYILYRFFPRLRAGSVVIFQDFFYHWSATLIAAVQLLVELGVVAVKRSAASSLLTAVLQPPTPARLLEFDARLQTIGVPVLIDRAHAGAAAIELDRAAQFLPRLLLAKVQYLMESGNHAAAAATVERYLGDGGGLNDYLVKDYLDLMRSGFSVKLRYAGDGG